MYILFFPVGQNTILAKMWKDTLLLVIVLLKKCKWRMCWKRCHIINLKYRNVYKLCITLLTIHIISAARYTKTIPHVRRQNKKQYRVYQLVLVSASVIWHYSDHNIYNYRDTQFKIKKQKKNICKCVMVICSITYLDLSLLMCKISNFLYTGCSGTSCITHKIKPNMGRQR